jgi:hypothetical protein
MRQSEKQWFTGSPAHDCAALLVMFALLPSPEGAQWYSRRPHSGNDHRRDKRASSFAMGKANEIHG